MDGKKVIINITCTLVVSACLYLGGFFTARSIYSRAVDECNISIAESTERYNQLSEAYTRITEINSDLQGRLDSSIFEAERATGIIKSISEGLGSTSGDIQSIIECLQRIVEQIREYEGCE